MNPPKVIRGGLVLALAIGLGCTQSPPSAENIVLRSIDFHGGVEAFRDLDSLGWDKTTTLLKEDGSLESTLTQRQTYFGSSMPHMVLSWREDRIDHKIETIEGQLKYTIGDTVYRQGEMAEKADRLSRSAAYVFFQPFKLLDSGTLLDYAGRISLGDSLEVDVIEVSYEGEEEGADRWRYYFTPEGRFVANSVVHQGRISLIVNTAQQLHQPTGLLVHKARKSYFVDSLLNIRYLRANYLYELQ